MPKTVLAESEMSKAERTRAILITGAASGIGRATALHFASKGWLIGAADANAEGLASLVGDIGNRAIPLELDVSDRDAFGLAAIRFGAATGGTLDILFNNAGIGLASGPFEQTRFEDVEKAISVNLLGVMAGIHACFGLLKATPNALCINTSSASAIFGLPNIAVYSASKGAVKTLTEALSIEFAGHDIRVADILPGLVATPLISSTAQSKHDGPFRVIQPEAIAEIVWTAYGSDKIHWYAPDDLQDLALAAVTGPESMRKTIADKVGAYAWLNR